MTGSKPPSALYRFKPQSYGSDCFIMEALQCENIYLEQQIYRNLGSHLFF